ncbi:class I SAM-dependent methyltransferase [Actinomadura oligospora]|uniref:class I SAM-dependent methyltransferase n=1 Tax=Actinomadura oligospora TaxID=111804 RepID=UPI0004BC8E48|nr:class I SAM-dependent methyltransferase [Actinomadura oligospora]
MIAISLAALLIVGLLLNAARMRGRAAALSALEAPGDDPGRARDGDEDLRFLVAEGVVLDEEARLAAAAHAHRHGADIVDLVPRTLPVTAARDLVRHMSPPKDGGPGNGRGPGAAVLVTADVLERAETAVPDAISPPDLIVLARRLKHFARDRHALVVAPTLRPAAGDLARRRSRLRASGTIVPVDLALAAIPFALLVAEAFVSWPLALACLAVYCLQPYLVFAGTALRPSGLHLAALGRPLYEPYVWVRTAFGRWTSETERQEAAMRTDAQPYYDAELAEGVERFLEERRDTCPWCGADDLSVQVRGEDLVYHKPGSFTLERCGGCGHIFQNPRLTPDGLDFYYRDFYDGIGAAAAETIFTTSAHDYLGRARMLEPFATPKRWLDVGAGHAHFCAAAREVWPDTVFDGLDWGAEIEEAVRRGWIEHAHRGMFPDLADEIRGVYDVVSMHHYLEHTRAPFAELDAAARVLPPGGHLLIELPDPEWRLGRLFGKYWVPWFQPQHQHMMPIGNLKRALADRGLTPVAEERAEAHQRNDFVLAAYQWFARLAPDRNLPWSAKRRTPAWRVWRGLVWIVGVPAVLAGLLVDNTFGALVSRRTGTGSAYRVLARKDDHTDA